LAEDEIRFDLPVTDERSVGFSRAVGEDNQILYNADAARHQGLPNILAAPTFTVTQIFEVDREERERRLGTGLDYGRVLHGEQEFVYSRLPVVGETLRGRLRIAKDFTKEGRRGGSMRFVTYESVFEDADGEHVLTANYTLIETSKDADA
jgi:N-terminal half of MaoC dehydratase